MFHHHHRIGTGGHGCTGHDPHRAPGYHARASALPAFGARRDRMHRELDRVRPASMLAERDAVTAVLAGVVIDPDRLVTAIDLVIAAAYVAGAGDGPYR